MLDKAEYSAFVSTLNYRIVSYRNYHMDPWDASPKIESRGTIPLGPKLSCLDVTFFDFCTKFVSRLSGNCIKLLPGKRRGWKDGLGVGEGEDCVRVEVRRRLGWEGWGWEGA